MCAPKAACISLSGMMSSAQALLSVRGLTTVFDTPRGSLTAVDDVSFTVARGSTLGLVGESGCGKSVTAPSIMSLIDPPGRIRDRTRIYFTGRPLMGCGESEMR